jgi:hypothetical protein
VPGDVRGRRLHRMLADPDLTGDLLLLGLALAVAEDIEGRSVSKLSGLARQIWPRMRSRDDVLWKLRHELQRDTRTYRPPEMRGQCAAPMQRRTTPCGRRFVVMGYHIDFATGERYEVAACSRHQDWYRSVDRLYELDRKQHPDIPMPCANSGGVLARHFTEIDWPKLWLWADPQWVEHPETVPWPKPTLTLLVGDDTDSTDDESPAPRPTLTLAP